MKSARGFTLVELLVVIAIIAILSTVGVVAFRGVTSGARDSARKADIQAINKAFEAHYTPGSGYDSASLSPSYFASGSIPTPPEGGNYFIASATDGSGVQICSKLEGFPKNGVQACNSSSSTCYCKPSVQSTSNPNADFNYFNSAGNVDNTSSNPSYVIGFGGGGSQSPSSCDLNGTLDDGLVGYWKMDELSSPFFDYAGSNSGSWTGGVSSSSLPDDINNSSFIRSGKFDGTTGYINLGDKFDMGDSSFTISAWIKKSPSTGDKWEDWIVGKRPNGTAPGYAFDVIANLGGANAGKLHLRYYTTAGHKEFVFTSNEGDERVDNNIWHWVAMVIDREAAQARLYLDNKPPVFGSLSGVTGNADNSDSFMIGNANWNQNSKWNGLLDDVRVYNRALSQDEMNNLYNGGLGCIPQ